MRWVPLMALGAALAAAVVLGLGMGAVRVPPRTIARMALHAVPGVGPALVEPDWPGAHAQIILQIRLPRVLQGALVGAGLAIAGAVFQGLFRNPLAGPYVLGVSSGAALGAVLGLAAGWRFTWMGLDAVPLLALAGALMTLGLVYALARTGGTLPAYTLLLAGTAVGALCSALISLVIHLAGDDRIGGIVFWLMGGLGSARWQTVAAGAPYLAAGLLAAALCSRDLNALLLGEEPARHLGVEVERVKAVLLVAASLLTAAAVATSGMIGFVGLVTPHVVRLIAGPDHRLLVPAAALGGAAFLVLADLAARSVLAPAEIQVGVITALVGAPFFIWLLRQTRRRGM